MKFNCLFDQVKAIDTELYISFVSATLQSDFIICMVFLFFLFL